MSVIKRVSGHPLCTGARVLWRRSSYTGDTGDCVEVAGTAARCLVRDSKDPAGAVLAFSLGEWVDFVEQVKSRAYDL